MMFCKLIFERDILEFVPEIYDKHEKQFDFSIYTWESSVNIIELLLSKFIDFWSIEFKEIPTKWICENLIKNIYKLFLLLLKCISENENELNWINFE